MYLIISLAFVNTFRSSIFVVIRKYLTLDVDSYVSSMSCIYIELVISVLNFYISFFDVVDGGDRTVGDECVLFLDDCFVDVLVCDSLYSVGNELDCFVVVWVRSLVYNTFEDYCVVGRCAEFVRI